MIKPLRSVWRRFLPWLLMLVAVAWVCSAAMVIGWGMSDRARPADAIVVLGAAQYVGRPSPVLQARLDHALALWQRGLAPRLILTGGTGVGDTTSEAAVSRRYLVRKGVPDSALLLENEGHTTRESMAAVASIMEKRDLRQAILVSDPFHMLRLHILARRFGVVPFTSPTRTSPISSNYSEVLGYVLSESFKVPLTLVLSLGADRSQP